MEQTHKNKNAAKGEKTTKALLSFLIENKKRLEELKYKRGANHSFMEGSFMEGAFMPL
ncbi:hypothetical protein RirG_177310 [Rhizophagus irregularis DAOM 197198w]|uniref:Uncharacterized protein n=2 Tax=Rhizophagus irregularis TaxID=588596 RepID=A0A015K049_RHIIW|nr:hypothetical protein RirG_177310 [Rhizophagus irregularis DAOM 197198w]